MNEIDPLLNDVTPKLVSTWIVVTQVKSHRVVYFTDDQSYQPPMDGDWYYYSPYAGDLPVAMTLRNCWGWRFNGSSFVDAREVAKKTPEETLIESNRQALLKILNEKINAIRKPFMPNCRGGEVVRELKLLEAEGYLALNGDGQVSADTNTRTKLAQFSQLEVVATSRNISLLEAAKLVVSKTSETRRVLVETERFREQLSRMIQSARTQDQLLKAREYLLDQIYPELFREFKYQIENTQPIDLDRPIHQPHKVHEVTRLKAQLREIINRKRAALQSRYVQNDEIRKHKARLAQAVLSGDEKQLTNLDLEPLRAYATARGLDLKTAAQLIVDAMAVAADLLIHTESLKDQMIPRIEAISTLRDIRDISAELDTLEQTL